jgi:hypothetical protein
MRGLFDFLWGSVPAEFQSRFGLDESVRRLSNATRRFVFLITRSVAVGKVSRDRVSLCRVMPFYGNFFFFVGKFREQDGRVVLSGVFALSDSFKALMTFWLGFFVLWTSLVILGLLIRGDPPLWWFLLGGVGMLGAGLTFVWLLKWMSRNDVVWLSRLIQDALSANIKPE